MADYWKSQPRKFCQYCKCWIADNKPSVEFHERGKNHKENVAAKIAEIKKKSLDKAKQEDRMSKEFAAMEDAAMKAYKEDLKRMQMESGESVAEDPPEPQPKPQPQPQQPPKQEKPHKKASHGKPGKQGKSGKPGKPGKSNLWMEGKSEDGHTYYYNTETGESLWEKPEGFQGDISTASHHVGQKEGTSVSAWMEAVSPEGYTYYFNSETGESSWERPADLPPLEEPSAPGTEPTPGVEERAHGAQVQAEASAPTEGAGEANQQSNVPKISFRKRKAEPLEHEAEGEADRREGGGAEGGGGKGEVKEEKENTSSAPPVPNEATGKEEKPEARSKEQQQQQKDENKDRVQERPARRPRRTTPYGSWEPIKPEKDPYASVDLQLPQMEEDDTTAADVPELVLPPEPKHKFTERTITSLGELGGLGGPAAFRKSKTHNGKARSLRQRAADD